MRDEEHDETTEAPEPGIPKTEPAPQAQRDLTVDDVESDEGDDVKGGGISIATPCM